MVLLEASLRSPQWLPISTSVHFKVTDTLERALTYSTPDTPLHSGLQATHQQLLAVLRGEGVVPMQIAIGSRLDPVRHEAVGTRAALEPHLTIVHVERNGYMRDA